MYHIEALKYLRYYPLKDIGAIANPHRYFLVLVLPPQKYNGTYLLDMGDKSM